MPWMLIEALCVQVKGIPLLGLDVCESFLHAHSSISLDNLSHTPPPPPHPPPPFSVRMVT